MTVSVAAPKPLALSARARLRVSARVAELVGVLGLLAVMLWVVGPHPWTPRLLSMLLAVATVGLTYWLGRSLGGPIAGLVAGGLLLFSAVHILINSHIAWSNATTPFFTTLAFCT